MFTIVISEKGGAERRETFEKSEISVGRVQGNDLMLPKGNVSKHHARLLSRDGRFIVTDLKSTNGTYVNGRKTSQATIVREGDKIYIGDFILRLESGSGSSSGDLSREDTGAQRAQLPSAANLSSDVPSAPPQAPMATPPVGESSPAIMVEPLVGSAAVVARSAEPSHYPLERDPDSESAPELRGAPVPHVPAPPRLPRSAELRPRSPNLGLTQERSSMPPTRAQVVPGAVTRPPMGRASTQSSSKGKQAARRVALITLVGRVGDVVDTAALDRSPEVPGALVEQIERAAREQAQAMRVDGEAPDGVDLNALARDAVGELVGLGPIATQLEDDDVREIHVAGAESVRIRKGETLLAVEPAFTSQIALARVVARLAHKAGLPLREGETLVERRLASGEKMVAVGPHGDAGGWALTIRKRHHIQASLDDLLRSGTMSRAMASFLETYVVARARVLVVGPTGESVATILAALAAAVPVEDHTLVLQGEDDEIGAPHGSALPLPATGPERDGLMRTSARLAVDQLIITSLGAFAAPTALDVIGGRGEGVLAGLRAPSLRQGLSRLVARLALEYAGASIEAAREVVAESFDGAVEAGRGPDGKLRVLRLAELAGSDGKAVTVRDLFVAASDGAGQASFVATGTTPRFAQDLAMRGIRLDTALFRRPR